MSGVDRKGGQAVLQPCFVAFRTQKSAPMQWKSWFWPVMGSELARTEVQNATEIELAISARQVA